MNHLSSSPRPRLLLLTGGVLLILLQSIHFADVLHLTQNTPLFALSELIRANITPFAWCAYLLFLLGFLSFFDRRSYLTRFRNRIAVCWLFSVPAWCYFDWMNFYFMRDPHTGLRAWEYVNLPPNFIDRLLGYLLAFGAIAPGMFLTAEALQRIGFHKLRFNQLPLADCQLPIEGKFPIGNRKSAIGNHLKSEIGNPFPLPIFLLGLLLAPIPIFIGTPASNLAIWVGTWALLDPINSLCGRPSILRDWHEGRFGRTLALGTAGLLCGFLWEFWNYWSYTKWTYHLPFLGRFEHYKYFEMPVLGLIGFIAFGIETWTMWQTALILLSPFVEGERRSSTDRTTENWACI